MVSVTQKHFNIRRHRMFIEDHGLSTTWHKAIVCPCIDNISGDVNPQCSLCAGEGIYYYDPTTIIVMYSSLNHDRSLKASRLLDEILLDATFQDYTEIADGDRLLPVSERFIHQQLLIRGTTRPGGGTNERTFYRYPADILKIIDEDGVEYTYGTDVTLIADVAGYLRNINWVTAGPATGKRYSIRYQCQAEYEIFLSQPRRRREFEVKLASYCRLRRITSIMGDS